MSKIRSNQQINITEDCPSIKSNNQCLEIKEKLCCFGDTIGVREAAIDRIIRMIKSRLIQFRDSEPLLSGRGLLLEAKCRLYFACVRCAMLFRSETWPIENCTIEE